MTKITGVISEAVITGKVVKNATIRGDVKNTYVNSGGTDITPKKLDTRYRTNVNISYGSTDSSGNTKSSTVVTCNTYGWKGTALICVYGNKSYKDLIQFDVDGFEYIGSDEANKSLFYIKKYTTNVPSEIKVTISYSDGKSRWTAAVLVYLQNCFDVEIYNSVNYTKVTSVSYTPDQINFDDSYSFFVLNENYYYTPKINKEYFEVKDYRYQWFHFISPKAFFNIYADGSPTIQVDYEGNTSDYACFTQIKCRHVAKYKTYLFSRTSTSSFWESVKEYLLPNIDNYEVNDNSITLKNGDTPYMIIENTDTVGYVKTKFPYDNSSLDVSTYLIGILITQNKDVLLQYSKDISYDSYHDACITRTKKGKSVCIFVSNLTYLGNTSNNIYISDGIKNPTDRVYREFTATSEYYQLIPISISGTDDCLKTVFFSFNTQKYQYVCVINGKTYFYFGSFFIAID